jgi:hypothetical protein
MDTPIAIIIAGALIASVILFTFRFEVEAPSGGESMPVVVRLDRWSGEVAVCPVDVTKTLAAHAAHLECKP